MKKGYLQQIGKKIRQVRKQRGISQVKLSKKLPIAANALSRIETGQNNFHIMTLQSIAEALEVDIKVFL